MANQRVNFRVQSFYMIAPSNYPRKLCFGKKPSAIRLNVKKAVLNRELASKILRSVPEQEGFHFYLAIGEPTGETAVSLADFVEKMETIDVRSVNFHFPRKDFEKWI